MINPDQARAVAHCFVMMYRAECRRRMGEADLWRIAARAIVGLDDRDTGRVLNHCKQSRGPQGPLGLLIVNL